jgi:hypothetical protein
MTIFLELKQKDQANSISKTSIGLLEGMLAFEKDKIRP